MNYEKFIKNSIINLFISHVGLVLSFLLKSMHHAQLLTKQLATLCSMRGAQLTKLNAQHAFIRAF